MNRWEMLILGWALGSLSTAFVLSWFIARSSEMSQERLADALGRDLRDEIQIPRALADRMWKHIEPRLPR